MFYIEKDNKIILFDEDKEKLINTLEFLPEYQELEIKKTDRPIIDFRFADTKEFEKERERLDMFSLTAADVERAIYKTRGLDFDDVLNIVKDNPEIDLKALKIELKANNFYRGNPYINQIGALLGYSSDDLDYLFENGDFPEVVAENATSDDKLPT